MTRPLDDLLAAYGLPADPPAPLGHPSFSVVVRTQGRRPGSLNEALDSIATQTHDDIEVVVVVHGDGTTAERVAAAAGGRVGAPDVRVVIHEGGGRAAPLNTGIESATNDYVCFLDDDDLAMPEWLAAFAAAAANAPGSVIRAVALSQPWTADGGEEPVRATGPVERPFPDRFDLLSHMSVNLTPICSLAFPRAALEAHALRFDDSLPVFEDWDFLMRAAMALGVASIPAETTLYRRLDAGNADTAADEAIWWEAHGAVVDRLSAAPVLLPAGDARRLAGSHFVLGGRTRHEAELAETARRLEQVTRSPVAWLRAFGGRIVAAIRHRTGARRP